MKVLGVISARAGSKGIPRKNLRPLGGVPLLSHIITTAKKAKLIDRLILSTEDDEIARVGVENGIEVPFRRPLQYATDSATGISVAKHAMEAMDGVGYKADVVTHLFPTCPFIPSTKIDELIRLVLDGFDSAISLKRLEDTHPFRAQVIDESGSLEPLLKEIDPEKLQNRQELPDVFVRSGAAYVRKRELLENWDGRGFCLGKKRGGIELSDEEAVNIDRELDFLFAEFLISQRES